jgi:hypothetical protein
MALSNEDQLRLTEFEHELADDRLALLFAAALPAAKPASSRPGPARRMLCSHPQRRRPPLAQ